VPARNPEKNYVTLSVGVQALGGLSDVTTHILSRFSDKASRGVFWRIAAALTFREIKRRHNEGSDIAAPYIRFERFFAHDEFYTERFINLVAGERIFVDYLTSDWFSELTITDRITVTSLFRRAETSESIVLALNRRPMARENLQGLQNLDQDSLPQHLFIKSEPEYSSWQLTKHKYQKALISIPASLSNLVSNVFRGLKAGLTGFIITPISTASLLLIALPLLLLSSIGVRGKLITRSMAAIARRKLALQISLGNSAEAISRSLRKYEMAYGDDEQAVLSLVNNFKSPKGQSILTHKWLDRIPSRDRIFVTSLFRKASQTSEPAAANFSQILPSLNIKNQRDIPQISGMSPEQRDELNYFKSLPNLPTAKAKDTAVTQKPVTNVDTSEFSTLTSEEILKREGWLPQKVNGLDLIETIRSRSYSDLKRFTQSPDIELLLSTPQKTQLASFCAILGEAIEYSNPVFSGVDPILKITDKKRASTTQMARLLKTANANVLPYEYGDTDADGLTLRHIWTRLANTINSQVEFSEAVETLIAAYDAQPLSKITGRSVTFDTFLILDLEAILDRMTTWIDWDICGRSSLIAFAHLAAIVHDSKIFETALSFLEDLRGVPRAVTANLKNSFLSHGIHNIETIASGDISHVQTLEALDKKKKYLCLVEGGAGIRALRRLSGLSKNLICGPVIPTDAPRYPEEASLKYIDDYISKYSKRDMKLSFEIDEVVETYIKATTDVIRKTGVDERYAEAVEIAHSTMFFGIYQEALAVDVCEELLKEAKSFDGIIFLLNSGNVLSPLISDAVKDFGRENVYIGLESERSKSIGIAVNNVRQALKPRRKATAAPATDASLDWASSLSKWLNASMAAYEKRVLSLSEQDYALLTLEHVNGYYDSYVALADQSLKHMDVEIFTSRVNPQLNEYIDEGGFEHHKYDLRHFALSERPAPTRDWMPGLTSELKQALDGLKSPWFPKYQSMIHMKAESMLTNRLPQILDAVCYFRARFSRNRPQYVFTGPNQHTISRAASYAALALDIPVYDFLILASTHHPRYRHPVAKYAYIYDPWYRDIFETYMRMPAENIRVSGPLFDYGKRFNHAAKPNPSVRNKTHIVFFSQSGNFQNSCNMLEGICNGSRSQENVYITVKMHPHESPANLKLYENFAAKHGVTENINFIHEGDAVALINEADLVVQSFSNIGLDALLMKTPVITYKPPSDLEARIFLYEKDIGFVVKSKAALTKKVKTFLSDANDKTGMIEMAKKFALENEHFLRPDNAERVMAEVLTDIGVTPKPQ